MNKKTFLEVGTELNKSIRKLFLQICEALKADKICKKINRWLGGKDE